MYHFLIGLNMVVEVSTVNCQNFITPVEYVQGHLVSKGNRSFFLWSKVTEIHVGCMGYRYICLFMVCVMLDHMCFDKVYVDSLVQDCSNSSALALEYCSLALSHRCNDFIVFITSFCEHFILFAASFTCLNEYINCCVWKLFVCPSRFIEK